jgi:hypothetical protein
MHDAADIARMLAGQAPALVAELLAAGKRESGEWRVGSLAGEPGRSLAVHLYGGRAGVWSDFASGDAGDGLDLVAAVLYGKDKRAALAWARRWLGLGDGPSPAPQRQAPPPARPDEAKAEAEALRGAARRMFLSAQPSLSGTPAAAYLAARGIDLAELGRQPRSLRYAPELWNRESNRHWPAPGRRTRWSRAGSTWPPCWCPTRPRRRHRRRHQADAPGGRERGRPGRSTGVLASLAGVASTKSTARGGRVGVVNHAAPPPSFLPYHY